MASGVEQGRPWHYRHCHDTFALLVFTPVAASLCWPLNAVCCAGGHVLALQVCTGVMIHGYELAHTLCGGLQEFMKVRCAANAEALEPMQQW